MLILRNKLDSLLKNTQKSFNKFGGLLAENDQEAAERVFSEAEAAGRSSDLDSIRKALSDLERVAAQLTSAMMNPTPDAT